MKKFFYILSAGLMTILISCNSGSKTDNQKNVAGGETEIIGGQENVKDDISQKDVVKVALGSPDHTTLVAALKQAELISSLSNAGPFTVFAPTNEAFKKLPAGTLEDLMKNENKDKLINILQYHVFVSALQPDFLNQESTLNMVNGDDLKVTLKDGKPVLNGKANIIASIPASNGMVYVIDEVLLPPAK
ncbi:MAG: fasciclin domain-containing protein [Chitinophagaceae bacterium]|nr:fasciclin domain-containing protein [Chitinophagaceae bacterium]